MTHVDTHIHTFILCIDPITKESAGTEIDELDLAGLEINENILILHVPVQHTHGCAVLHSLNYLPEQKPSRALTHHTLPRDVVEEIDVLLGPLHDYVEVVVVLEIVQHLNDVLMVEGVEEGNLFGDHLLSYLGGNKEGRGERVEQRNKKWGEM